ADAEVSADGHNWSTAAVATDYTQKLWPATYSGRNRPYDFQGSSSAPAPRAGYLWEQAAQHRLTYRVYGEFFDFTSKPPDVRPAPFAKALQGHLSPAYAGYDLSVTDQTRVDAWQAEFEDFEPLGRFDAAAILMMAAVPDTRNLAPYRVLRPQQSLTERNTAHAYRARDSQALALDRADEANEEMLNAILWGAIKGPSVPMPKAKTAFPSPPGRDDDD